MKSFILVFITSLSSSAFAQGPMCTPEFFRFKFEDSVLACKPRGGLCFNDIDCCLGLKCGSVKRCD